MNLRGCGHRRAKLGDLLTGRSKVRKRATGTAVLGLVNEGASHKATLCLLCASCCSGCWNTVVNETGSVSALREFTFSWGGKQKRSKGKQWHDSLR